MELARDFVERDTRWRPQLFYLWGHSYEFTNHNNWELIEEFCRMMGGHEEIWYATNIEIVDYLKAWDQLQFSADGSFCHNPTATELWVEVNKEHFSIQPGSTQRLHPTAG